MTVLLRSLMRTVARQRALDLPSRRARVTHIWVANALLLATHRVSAAPPENALASIDVVPSLAEVAPFPLGIQPLPMSIDAESPALLQVAGMRVATARGGAGRKGGWLIVAETSIPQNLDPLHFNFAAQHRTAALVFNAPFQEDGAANKAPIFIDDQKTGGIALERTEDNCFRGRLHADIHFHNKQLLTAEDLAKSLDAYIRCGTSDFYRTYHPHIEPIGRDEFKLCPGSYPGDARDLLTFSVLPHTAILPAGLEGTECVDPKFGKEPIGTGPFIPVERDPMSLRLEAFPDYFQGEPALAGITIVSIPAMKTQLDELHSGGVHVVVELGRQQAVEAQSYGATVWPFYVHNFWYLGFNERKEEWRNPRLRRAILQVVNRGTLAQQLYVSEADIRETVTQSRETKHAALEFVNVPGSRKSVLFNDRVKALPTNWGKATAELKNRSTGLQKRDGRWIQKNTKEPWVVHLAVLKDLPEYERLTAALADQLDRFGITVSEHILDQESWIEEVVKGKGQYDLILGRWVFEGVDDISPIFGTNGPQNIYGYSNPTVDALLKEYAATDRGSYQHGVALMREVQKLIAADMPCLFLWEMETMAAVSPLLANYGIEPPDFYKNPHNWQLREKQ